MSQIVHLCALLLLLQPEVAQSATYSSATTIYPYLNDIAIDPAIDSNCWTSPQQRGSKHQVHFWRIPKTASTSVWNVFVKMLKSPMCNVLENVVFHGPNGNRNSHGCVPLPVCNASCYTNPPGRTDFGTSFTVMREPCARFASLLSHVRSPEGDDSGFAGLASLPWFRAADVLLKVLEEETGCVGNAKPDCIVGGVNKKYQEHPEWKFRARVAFWPQSFFANDKTEVICLREGQDVVPELFAAMSRSINCSIFDVMNTSRRESPLVTSFTVKLNSREHENLSREQCTRVRGLYLSDVLLWERKCRAL